MNCHVAAAEHECCAPESVARKTALYEDHMRSGAEMIDFNGWLLPLAFTGIVEEHFHCRSQVSLFDCCHMGKFLIRGDESIAYIDRLVFSDVANLPVGRCRYSGLLTERGGIVDDVVVLRLAVDELLVVTNASRLTEVARLLGNEVPVVVDLTDEIAKIDVQGPGSRHALQRIGITSVVSLSYFACCRTEWRNTEIVVSRCGYTGELGFELSVPRDLAPAMWNALLDISEVKPAGLGARDTLRLEMGYVLSGRDIDEQRTPLEARMDAFVAWDSEFRGSEVLRRQREKGTYSIRTGIHSFDRRAPRTDAEVRFRGVVVGVVTSGSYGPTVGTGIGMAYLPQDLAVPGTPLTVGSRFIPAEVSALPFYQYGTCRK
jgi:aminomethyltransferase